MFILKKVLCVTWLSSFSFFRDLWFDACSFSFFVQSLYLRLGDGFEEKTKSR